MTETAEDLALDARPETLARLEALAALVRRWTSRVNLVAASTLPDLWTRHVLDSAQLWRMAPPGARLWADLGSGAGFPGLVVAALAAEAADGPQVVLVESDGRKAAFLQQAAREMGLAVTVHDARAETLPPLGADVISARALAPLPALLPLAARHLSAEGTALLPKGRGYEAEVAEARSAGWAFDLETLSSATDPAARVLRLRHPARG